MICEYDVLGTRLKNGGKQNANTSKQAPCIINHNYSANRCGSSQLLRLISGLLPKLPRAAVMGNENSRFARSDKPEVT